MDEQFWLDQIKNNYRKYKKYSERAAEQVSDKQFFNALAGNPLSIAILMKHVGRNHLSRWRNFLTTDGEKADRNRDNEFILEGEKRNDIYKKWYEGWKLAFETLDSLTGKDLEKTITIRGEKLTVVEAIQRNLNHVVYHSGQIVFLARQFVGEDWQSLSIPIGKSDEYNLKMMEKYGNWLKEENN